MVRDLLALLPAEWTAAVDAAVLRELPTEFIGARGDKRIADLCWLADREGREPEGRGGGTEGAGGEREGPGGDPVIVLIENQSAPDPRMPARAMARTGLLYESLGAAARRPDGKFPPVLPVVVYTGHRPWRAPDDLTGLVHVPAGHPLRLLAERCYARLDLRDPASQYPERGNRMAALARLAFAESAFDAARLLGEIQGWLDFEDEDEARLYQCYRDWFYATERRLRPQDWNPERKRELEELMAEQTILERNTDRWLERRRQDWLAEGLVKGRRDGLAEGRREMLVRQAARRFGADIGRRLEARLRGVEDPGRLDRVGDLIVDSETAEQLLGGINRAGPEPELKPRRRSRPSLPFRPLRRNLDAEEVALDPGGAPVDVAQ